jgi:hypothetical protein
MDNVNFVFHDMMLFVEDKNYCDVLIPEVKEHDYRFGDPQTKFPTKFPQNLLACDYEVLGIPERKHPDEFHNHADKYLVLKKSRVRAIPALRRIGIRLPLPDEIHFFRKLIPHPNATATVSQTILNGSPSTLAVKRPPTLFDVVVFHYVNVDVSKVVFKSKDNAKILPQDKITVTGKPNLCIYAQTGKDFQCMQLPEMAHRTGINDLLHTAGVGGGKHPNFSLSRIGTAADEPNPGLGLTHKHMLCLRELMAVENDEGGCYGAAVSRRGGI